MKDLTEHSEEVGNRKPRPKERVLSKSNHADTRALGKIAPDNFAGRPHVAIFDVQIAQSERFLVLGFPCMATIVQRSSAWCLPRFLSSSALRSLKAKSFIKRYVNGCGT